QWQGQLDYISQQVKRIDGVSTSFFVPDIANHVPHMSITWDSGRIALTPKEVSKLLADSTPSIIMGGGEGRPGLAMNSFMLQPGENKVVADQLTRIFGGHSAGGK